MSVTFTTQQDTHVMDVRSGIDDDETELDDLDAFQTTTVNSDTSDQFLERGKGIVGVAEGLPMPIKIVILCVIAFTIPLAMASFIFWTQSIDIKKARNTMDFLAVSKRLSRLAAAIQDEREIVVPFLYSFDYINAETPNLTYVDFVFPKTDAVVKTVHGIIPVHWSNSTGNSSRLVQTTNRIGELLSMLPETRDYIETKETSGQITYGYYTDLITNVHNLITILSAGRDSQLVNSYITMLKVLELGKQVKTSAAPIFMYPFFTANDLYTTLKPQVTRDAMIERWKTLVGTEDTNDYDMALTDNDIATYFIVEREITKPRDNMRGASAPPGYTFASWSNQSDILTSVYEDIIVHGRGSAAREQQGACDRGGICHNGRNHCGRAALPADGESGAVRSVDHWTLEAHDAHPTAGHGQVCALPAAVPDGLLRRVPGGARQGTRKEDYHRRG
jgi:hypothetical protein